MEVVTFSTVTFVLGLIGLGITAYKSINNPQVKLDKTQALNEERDKSKATVLAQKETESKAQLLAEQVKWEKKANGERFAEVNKQITNLIAVNQNHLHTLEMKIDAMGGRMGTVESSIIKLQTIIEERIPK